MDPLRKCITCGLEARTEEELELFTKAKLNKYGRRNMCKKCHAKQARGYRKKHFDGKGICRGCRDPLDRVGAYCTKCLKKMSAYFRKRHWELRLKAILKLGGVCVVCGITDIRILTINHLEGRNYRTTVDKNDTFYHRILNGKRDLEDLEVRCYNCNALYEFEMGYRSVPENLDPELLVLFEVRT